MASDQREPFLSRYSSDEEEPKDDSDFPKARPSHQWRWKHAIIIHGVLILSYTIAFYVILRRHAIARCDQLQNGQDFTIPVEFTTRPTTFHNLSQTPYAGDKSMEDLDTAWDELLAPMNMRFSTSELASVNQESIALPEKGGYMGWFGVFHNLHCVKMLRHSFDRARQCNSTEEESRKEKQHVDHCIELLRQSSVCQPDTSLTTFIWDKNTELPMFNVSESVHTCVDWDAFMEREKWRVVDDKEMQRLKNPLLDNP